MAWLPAMFGRGKRRPAAPPPPAVRARFDAAESGDDRRHWANADAFAADTALTPTTRATIRNRARYERNNNSYLAGIVETRSNDLIGTGPRLRLTSGNPDVDRAVEKMVFDWGWQIDLPGKLRTMFDAKQVDGEAFALFTTNPRLPGVQLDVRLVEAEMVATPTELVRPTMTPDGSVVDGLEFDAAGNVVAFHVLNYHPGANFRVSSLDFRRVDAAQVVHWYRAQRPGQHRGVSEIAPALRLFGQLRRYTEAVCAAAETAANFAGFLRTNSPAAEVDEVEPFAEMPIEKRAMVTLPDGWTFEQLRAEQPTSTYAMFKREIVGEMSRCLQLPYNVATLDSSSYNYASGRMDHQIYDLTVRVGRDELERLFLDRMLAAWVNEAALAGLLPDGTPPFDEWDWSWQWDGREHVDPSKEAAAARDRLETLTTTFAAEYAKQGKSWDVELRQIAAERALIRELGLEFPSGGTPDPLTVPPADGDNTPTDEPATAEATHGTQPEFDFGRVGRLGRRRAGRD